MRRTLQTVTVTLTLFGLTGTAQAGLFKRACRTPQPPACAPAQAQTYAPQAQTYAPQAQAQGTDPAGFIHWLNGVRAQYGLPAVGYDPNLTSWCHANNAQQRARGMGHHVMGPARRQNAAWGSNPSGMWLASPPHRDALLDPSIRNIGIAGDGTYWTFNAN